MKIGSFFLLIILQLNFASGQSNVCKRVYSDEVNKYRTGLVYYSQHTSDLFNISVGICPDGPLNIEGFKQSKHYGWSFMIMGDSLNFEYQDTIHSVFSPHSFKNRIATFYIKIIDDSLIGKILAIEMFQPDTVVIVQGELAFVYDVTYLQTSDIGSFGRTIANLEQMGIVEFDRHYGKSKSYFLPKSGLVFFADLKTQAFIIEGNCGGDVFERFAKKWNK